MRGTASLNSVDQIRRGQFSCHEADLQDEKSQEVKVGRSLELLVQIQGQERKHVVLVGLDGISLKTRKEKKKRHGTITEEFLAK